VKPWQLNKRFNDLSMRLAEPTKSDTMIDWRCLSEGERQLLEKVDEIIGKYAPSQPPQDVIEKHADLWYKGLEILGRRATELFVEVVPASLCCDELELWYFKLYFYNFWLDWRDSLKELREMPKKQHDALLCERRDMGLFDIVFRFQRDQPQADILKENTKK
jgi:hypothetical protein